MEIITLPEQEVEIDLEKSACEMANGDIVAFSRMLCNFCEHLRERERRPGFRDLQLFNVVFGTLVENLNDSQFERLKEIVNSAEA